MVLQSLRHKQQGNAFGATQFFCPFSRFKLFPASFMNNYYCSLTASPTVATTTTQKTDTKDQVEACTEDDGFDAQFDREDLDNLETFVDTATTRKEVCDAYFALLSRARVHSQNLDKDVKYQCAARDYNITNISRLVDCIKDQIFDKPGCPYVSLFPIHKDRVMKKRFDRLALAVVKHEQMENGQTSPFYR